MNHSEHLSGWPVVFTWVANGILWMTVGMNPLQILATVIALGYTIHRWILLRKQKGEHALE